MGEVNLRWASNPEEATELALFFASNVDPDYVSHGDVVCGRATEEGRWKPDLQSVVEDEIRSALEFRGPKRILVGHRNHTTLLLSIVVFGPPKTTIEDMVVCRTMRGTGIGSNAVRFIEDEARTLGESTLWMESGGDNVRTHALAQRFGFRLSSVVMRKNLGPTSE